MAGSFTRIDNRCQNRTPVEKLLEAWPQIDVHMLARQLMDGAETTITFKPGLHFSVKAKAGFLDIDGQQIRVGWHASLPLRTFECPGAASQNTS